MKKLRQLSSHRPACQTAGRFTQINTDKFKYKEITDITLKILTIKEKISAVISKRFSKVRHYCLLPTPYSLLMLKRPLTGKYHGHLRIGLIAGLN